MPVSLCAQGMQGEQSNPHAMLEQALGDIRLDEDYEQFYQLYSGRRKLPPPVGGRTLYQELPGLMRPQMQSMGMHPGTALALLLLLSGLLCSAASPLPYFPSSFLDRGICI